MGILIALLLAGQQLELPTDAKTTVSVPFKIKPLKLDGAEVVYFCADKSLILIQEDLADKTMAYAVPQRAGSFLIYAVTSKGDKILKPAAEMVLVVTGGNAPPVVPPSVDPLIKRLQDLVSKAEEQDPGVKLAAIAKSISEAKASLDSCATLDDVEITLKGAYLRNKVNNALAAVRSALGAELISKVGDDPATKITPALLTTIKAEFDRYIGILNKMAE